MTSFEKVFNKHKEDLTQALVLFGEGVRVNKLLADEESKRQEYYKFYEEGFKAGQQSKQQEIDELIKSIDWHIEDCELRLYMNKNDYYQEGFKAALLAIKKRLE